MPFEQVSRILRRLAAKPRLGGLLPLGLVHVILSAQSIEEVPIVEEAVCRRDVLDQALVEQRSAPLGRFVRGLDVGKGV